MSTSRSQAAHRGRGVALLEPDVAEVQIRRRVPGVELDRRLEAARRLGVLAALQRGEAELVLEKREDLLVPRRLRPGRSRAASFCRIA